MVLKSNLPVVPVQWLLQTPSEGWSGVSGPRVWCAREVVFVINLHVGRKVLTSILLVYLIVHRSPHVRFVPCKRN